MKRTQILIVAACLLASGCEDDKRAVLAMRQEAARIETDLAEMERTLRQKSAVLEALAEQMARRLEKIDASMRALETGAGIRLESGAPLSGVNARLGEMQGEVKAVRAAADELNARLRVVQERISEMADSALRAPPAF